MEGTFEKISRDFKYEFINMKDIKQAIHGMYISYAGDVHSMKQDYSLLDMLTLHCSHIHLKDDMWVKRLCMRNVHEIRSQGRTISA